MARGGAINEGSGAARCVGCKSHNQHSGNVTESAPADPMLGGEDKNAARDQPQAARFL
jgi:hypothetical protein